MNSNHKDRQQDDSTKKASQKFNYNLALSQYSFDIAYNIVLPEIIAITCLQVIFK